MSKKTYFEKLKHPKWQKKRLEILQRDDFTCVLCGEKEVTLHVHHVSYKYGYEPWDYPDNKLKTLCEYCHKREHSFGDAVLEEVKDGLKNGKFLYGHLVVMTYLYEIDPDYRKMVDEKTKTLISNANQQYLNNG